MSGIIYNPEHRRLALHLGTIVLKAGQVEARTLNQLLLRSYSRWDVAHAIEIAEKAGLLLSRKRQLVSNAPEGLLKGGEERLAELAVDYLFMPDPAPLEWWVERTNDIRRRLTQKTYWSKKKLKWAWRREELPAWVAWNGKDLYEVGPYNRFKEKWFVIKNRLMWFGFEDSLEDGKRAAQREVRLNSFGTKNGEKNDRIRANFFAFFRRVGYNRCSLERGGQI